MTETNECSLVVVYTSPAVEDALIVQGLLETEGIRAAVAAAEGPLLPSSSAPSEVLVWSEDEARARLLVNQAENQHQQQVEREEAGLCDADRHWS
ncbi:MAG: hypothetical protein NTZ32_04790 [Planctomycetales bacterium]|nr:hypothetical protein [Planctomycetales bacterium]